MMFRSLVKVCRPQILIRSRGFFCSASRNCCSFETKVHRLEKVLSRNFKTSQVKRVESSDSGILSKRVEVNGVKFHIEKAGNGEHVVLCFPGALGSTRTDFGPQLENFHRDKFTLIAFDPRGFGKSIPPERDWPSDFYQRDAEDAVSVMKALEIKKFSILGWSDGGICGMIIAGRYPELVNKLVIFGSNAYVSDHDVTMVKGVEDISNWSERMRKPFEELYGKEYFKKQWSNWVKAYEVYYKKGGDICKEELPKIKAPTLVVHGSKDPMVAPEHIEYIMSNIKGAKIHIFPEGKHNIHLRYPEEFRDVTETFLQSKL